MKIAIRRRFFFADLTQTARRAVLVAEILNYHRHLEIPLILIYTHTTHAQSYFRWS